MRKLIAGFAGAAALGLGPVQADQPVDGGISMVPAASPLAEEVHAFHNLTLMPIITVISLFVLALLVWVILRYNSKANPVPRKFSHNTLIEIVWTGVPILILVYIALFSFDLLYKEDVVPDGKQVVALGDGATSAFVIENDFPESRRAVRAEHVQVMLASASGERKLAHKKDYTLDGLGDEEIAVTLNEPAARGERVVIRAGRSLIGTCGFWCMGEDRREIVLAPSLTIKATGYQWNWSYSYPEFGEEFEFFSNMLEEDQTTPDLYRWEVDNRVVIPVGETVRVIVTAADVIHAWALPNFAVKIDAVPGRLNETWIKADREGVYYGQCSEICGVKHSFMPIAVEVVSRPAFEAWVDSRRAVAGLEPIFGDEATRLAQANNE